jgi:hypothetical protein
MLDAAVAPITTNGQPLAVKTAIPTNDALLLGLAEEYRGCEIRGKRKWHSGAPDRSDMLLMAICAMSADGPTGAAVQAQAIDEVADRLEWSKSLRRVCTDFAHDSIAETLCHVDIGGTLQHWLMSKAA